jgi:hypothetical protein
MWLNRFRMRTRNKNTKLVHPFYFLVFIYGDKGGEGDVGGEGDA